MRNSLSSRGFLAITATWLVLLLPRATSAQASDDSVFVTATADYSASPDFRAESRGVGASAGAFWGFHRWFSLGGQLGYAHHFPLPSSDEGTSRDILGAFAGVAYNIDVLEVVPFVALQPGLIYDGAAVGAIRAALGFDYRPSRRWAFGADVAWHVLLDDATAFPGYSVVRLRFSRVFDLRAL